MSYLQYLENPEGAARKNAGEILSLAQRVEALLGTKNTPTTVGGVQPYIHGAGGLLSSPGQDPALFSTLIRPEQGIANTIPVLNDPILSPDYGGHDVPLMTTITGVTAGDGDLIENQPTESCGDAPVAGLLKACTLTAPFGNYTLRTRQIDRKRVGRLNNRGEMTDYVIRNAGDSQDPLTPTDLLNGTGSWINNEIQTRYFEAGVSFQRLLAPRTYTATPTNNSGAFREFIGYDSWYNTGNKVDIETSAPCPSMDSVVGSFGADITTTNADGLYIYQVAASYMRYFRNLADQTGLSPARWVLSMRWDLFWELTEIWTIQQYVQQIATVNAINGANVDGGIINMDARDSIALRDQLRQSRMLPIDGEMVNVVLDSGVSETSLGSGQFSSTVYFHPMTVLGSVPVNYWQFFNFDNGQGRMFDEQLSRGQTYTTDGGRTLWAANHKNGCAELQFWVQPRLMMHTPFLGGRLTDVRYTPAIHSRDWNPSDPNYYNGGRTNSSPLTGYPEWSPTTQVNLGVID